MNELHWSGGERCRVGDVVQWPGGTSRNVCTAIGEAQVILKSQSGGEFSMYPANENLLHRAGEAEDRSPEYEYRDDNGNAWLPSDWQKISDDGTNATYRRLRQPPAPPADVDIGFTGAPTGFALSPPACEPVEPPPAPTKRRMKANRQLYSGTYHGQVHNENAECRMNPSCEPVEPPPAPAFDAVVCEVGVDPLDGGVTVLFDQHTVPAIVGQGHDGYTIAAFCESESEAQGCVDYYRTKGELPSDIGWLEIPMDAGRPLPFAVAVKVTK